jgi:predicted nucleotidyltransferase
MPQPPTRREIAEQDRYMLARLAAFRRAADAVVTAFATFPEVRAVTLFGSVARPLGREVPRFQRFRRFGIELLHECKDVDLAVLIDGCDNLSALNRARNKAVADTHAAGSLGVAHHQVDVFLFNDGWNNYLGRLCTYGRCPKGKVECLVPGCGSKPFLKQHREFAFRFDALAADRIVPLYERGRGVLCHASDFDNATRTSLEPGTPSIGGAAAQ